MNRTKNSTKTTASPLTGGIKESEFDRLTRGDHHEPHAILGAHPARMDEKSGTILRAFHPDATRCELLLDGDDVQPMERIDDGGVFAAFVPVEPARLNYRYRFSFEDDETWVTPDPYRFLPTLGDMDLHLFNEGTHRRLWKCLGAHVRTMDGVSGVAFAVWAPSARRVSVVGDFCRWDGRLFPMRSMGSSGVFELFIPGVRAGELYKYEIKTQSGDLRLKTDPLALSMEVPPGTASRVIDSHYEWGDGAWMDSRREQDVLRSPVAIYEVHLGSWARVPEEGGRPLTYREIAPRLVEHVKRFGFTHIELMPIAEHPFTGSWGYQVSGYFAPTSRHGSPDDFRYFVDHCHQNGIGVILDWVPGHFVKDDFALRRFDGTALYEHDDPRRGEHPDWGTLIFNYGRDEVRGYLVANALYWLDEFHVDGLRVDGVASMLYLDYSRKEGEWMPNRYGGRENIEAIDLLRSANAAIHEDFPGCFTAAEESTAWGGVTAPTYTGGLGFTFKWNMGWMHDTLLYFSKDPIHRVYHHDQLTFAMLYEYTERFIMPLSHDEVVHGKRSLLDKMPGDIWQKFANLRTLLAYQYTRPGKKLLFMGTEIAPWSEWDENSSLDWHVANDPERVGLQRFLQSLGHVYRDNPALWHDDHDPIGYGWIDCNDRDNSVISYWRRGFDRHLVVVLNLTPVPRDNYRIGVPFPGKYAVRICSDDREFFGSGFLEQREFFSEPSAMHGHDQSIAVKLPPLAALVLEPCP